MKILMVLLLLGAGFGSTETIPQSETKYVEFTLRNTTAKSIPLKIPGVMNPNLSPFSNSGVSLKVGQEVFFYKNRRKHLLLKVTEAQEGQTLIVNKLIKQRKKDLGID